MREFVSCELLLHSEFYGNYPYITKKNYCNIAHYSNLIFALTISNDSSVILTDNKSKASCIINQDIKNALCGVYSLFIFMLALSSVLCCNIESVYPDQGSLVGKILNGTIKPRNSEFKTTDTPAILWTSSKNSGTFRPNYFVQLINSSKLNQQKCKTTQLEGTAEFPNIGK